jgi:DNA-binding CsgD family transcriptional regulator
VSPAGQGLVHIFAKLSVQSRSELAAEAIRRGMT